MSNPSIVAPAADTSKSDDEQFEDAQSKNERCVDEVIEKVTGLSMKKPPESDTEEFADCEQPAQQDSGEKETEPEHAKKLQTSKDDADDFIDEDSQRDYETGLTEEERTANRAKADELKQQGNELFKRGDHRQSALVYTSALRVCPLDSKEDRAILYANRAAAKCKLNLKPSAIDDCTKALEYNPKYVKALLRRANLYEETDKLDESLEDFRKVLELDPGNGEARGAQVRLPPKIADRNERLKEEMLGKLKDLGNLILRPFGLSTQNFQMQQDPQSGSYSINFKQNANQ
ncbi:tetratricopeptide repeat protein 1-like [Anopheles albimanus]|uniref:TPR_REGION domain-containing protein n=1 Tax=Anopheles albimanus TaxID=7167 RepID=A0A182FP84_ANOAL|nr:tetratricopeptide repeat protein 1-like [Anopheles albimanus]XP_035780439.1 tetratricopeptide repeat protein 1-like [Anopheles albimanus]